MVADPWFFAGPRRLHGDQVDANRECRRPRPGQTALEQGTHGPAKMRSLAPVERVLGEAEVPPATPALPV